jgi:DNA-binding transcriptional LysR family regulator
VTGCATQRLAVLERRVGVALEERDTTGARLPRRGLLLAEHGRRALDLPDGLTVRLYSAGDDAQDLTSQPDYARSV